MITTEELGALYRAEAGRILATLIRVLGDFDLAEEVLQEAFAAALAQWPSEGAPDNPRAWLTRTARNKAIDHLRHRSALLQRREQLAAHLSAEVNDPGESAGGESSSAGDLLRLIFTCCHPVLPMEAQVALTLHTLCGLSTEAIARAFLVPLPTLAQRLTRAKARIRDAAIPYQVPPPEQLAERVDAVLVVIYLVFNEGYAAAAGEALVRRELCAEAIRLGRLLCQLLPTSAEAQGLLGLMLAHDARAAARTDQDGALVLLEDQERSRWNHAQIREAAALAEGALRIFPPGPYALQAAIATLHGQAPRAQETDWRQISALYALLSRVQPTAVVELNYAVALAMADGPERGLPLLDALAARGALAGYHLLPAARADLLRRMNRWGEAAAAYREALALCANQAERAFLARRLAVATGAAAASEGDPAT